jgi:hypothetical protein
MLAPELMVRLNERGHAVVALRFHVGELDLAPRPPERRATRKVPPPAPLGPELGAVVAAVGDDELRKTIEAAARANLAWQTSLVVPTEGPPTSRAPRGAGTRTAPPGRSEEDSDEASPRSSADARDRRR